MKIARFLDSFLSLKIHFYFIRKVPLRLRVISQFSHHYKLEDAGNVKELRNLRNVSNDRIGQIYRVEKGVGKSFKKIIRN